MSDCMSLLVQCQFGWHKFPRFAAESLIRAQADWVVPHTDDSQRLSTWTNFGSFSGGNLTGTAAKIDENIKAFRKKDDFKLKLIFIDFHHASHDHPSSFMSTCHSCIPSTQLFFVKGLLQRHICEARTRPWDRYQISEPSGYVNSWRT